MVTPKRLLMAVTVLTAVATAPPLGAQEKPDWQALDRVMADGLDSAQTWRQRWSLFFAGSAVFSALSSAGADTDADEYDGRVRAITSTLGLLDTIIKAPPHLSAYRRHHAIDRDAPGALADARRNARALAQAEQSRTGWRGRLGSLIVNGGAYHAIAEEDGRHDDALQVALTGMLVNEIKLWTFPRTMSESSVIGIGQAAVEVETDVYLTANGIGAHLRF
ncbi:hypothetical protein [Halospina sp. K52047b]|uniref:hypothetical protein n=1 Tax=Halospina sp. K52047b TaxID=2614160 RepID=UPI00124ACE74|nr:hypothetical protein [Halospina sp. K52047b]KAA8980307.1 hypothetical protein F3089_11620 [Halospina sp. K52047b]